MAAVAMPEAGEQQGRSEEPEPVTPEQQAEGAQAVDDRRLLRSQYLAVKSLISDERDVMASADSDKFRSIISKVEGLHQLVQRPREQIADAETLLDLTASLVASVRSESVLGITPAEFVAGLLKKFGKQRGPNDEDVSLNWALLGRGASHVFMSASGCATMVGPMKTEVQPRRVCRRKRTERPRGSTRPEQLADPSENTKTDTDKNMSAIFDLLRMKKNARLEHLVLNRTSFAQTVDNIFALSFLVKDGRVEINVNDEGHHIVYPRNAPAASAVASGKVVYNHFVFRFDFKDWKLMKGVVPEGAELMPHRSSQTAADTGGSNHNNTEPDVPPSAQGTAIRKLCRNRGLVSQDETVATGEQEVMQNMVAMGGNEAMEDKMAAGRGAKEREILAYKRRRLFQDN